jgi:hypothetical protein
MDDVRVLLRILVKVSLALFVAVFVWLFIDAFYPTFKPLAYFTNRQTIDASSSDIGWLPSPRNYQGMFGGIKTPGVNGNVYVHGKEYNGNYKEVQFVTYTNGGVKTYSPVGVMISQPQQGETIITAKPVKNTTQQNKKQNSVYSTRDLYIRNVSVQNNANIYSGYYLVGEIRETMMIQGVFPVIVANQSGQVLTVSRAEKLPNWSNAGWVKFQVKITGVLPHNAPCTMVFEQARVVGSRIVPIRVAIPVMCN